MLIENSRFIRTASLIEAVRLLGSEKNLGLAIKIKQPSISKLLSNSIMLSYYAALSIEKATGINIDSLMPHEKEMNTYLKKREFNTLFLREIPKKEIITTNSVSLPFSQPNRFIIIGTDRVLISGQANLNSHLGNTIKALVLDLKSLINGTESIENILHKLLISERIAIGLRIEQLIGNRKGQRTTKNKINQRLKSIDYQITGRTYTHAAKITGFSKDTYIRGKKVYSPENQKLINDIDNKIIAIATAAKLIKFRKQQQQQI